MQNQQQQKQLQFQETQSVDAEEQKRWLTRRAWLSLGLCMSFIILALSFHSGLTSISVLAIRLAGLLTYWIFYILYLRFGINRPGAGYQKKRWTYLLLFLGLCYAIAVALLQWPK